MEIKDFFWFHSKLLSSTYQASALNLEKDKNGVPQHFNLIKGNYEGISFPVIFRHESGTKFLDLLDTGWPGLFLISSKLKTILEDNNLNGWATFPILLIDKKKREIPNYFGFSTKGKCGPVTFKNVKIIEKPSYEGGPVRQYYKGYNLGFDQWDGTDFFTPSNSYETIVTKDVAKILMENKVTNLNLDNLADIETDVSVVRLIDR